MDEVLKIPLRDIHLPDPISWWPLAPGWWALLILSLLTIALILIIRRVRARRRVRVAAWFEFEKLSAAFNQTQDIQQLVKALSVLLRRVCLSYASRTEAAALTGERWLDFLETHLGNERVRGRFKAGPGRALISAPYRASSEIDGPALLSLCGDWIQGLPPLSVGARR